MTKGLRIDSHQHFWSLARGDYDWLGPELAAIYRDYLPEHLTPLLARAGIDKTIIVQAAASIAETEFILALAESNDFVAGVVGWIDMEKPGAIAALERLSQNPMLLGIRPLIQDIADPDWMLREVLDDVFTGLIARDLTFDALVRPVHLDNLLTLLCLYPELKVVIDHGAKPDIDKGQFQPWADQMAAIAEATGAACKLSGLVTEAGDEPSYERLQPYMEHLLHCFGADRLMWGSDWPVCNLAVSYPDWVDMTDRFLSPLNDNERAAILGRTAQQFYRLDRAMTNTGP